MNTTGLSVEEFYEAARGKGWVVKGDKDFLYTVFEAAKKNTVLDELIGTIGSTVIWNAEKREAFIRYTRYRIQDAVLTDLTMYEDFLSLLSSSLRLATKVDQSVLNGAYAARFGHEPEEDVDETAGSSEAAFAPSGRKDTVQMQKMNGGIPDPAGLFRQQTNQYAEMLRKVEFKLIHLGSSEFGNMKDSINDLKLFADRNLALPGIKTEQLAEFMDLHARAAETVVAYLDHKVYEFEKDPGRKVNPRRQKYEQPRIVAATDLLKEMRSFQIYGEGVLVKAERDIRGKVLLDRLQAEEELRNGEDVPYGVYMRSVVRSIECLSDLNGSNWSFYAAETNLGMDSRLRRYMTRAERLARTLPLEKEGRFAFRDEVDQILRDRDHHNRHVLKAVNDLYKNQDRKKITNEELKQILLEKKYGPEYPYVDMNADGHYNVEARLEGIYAEILNYRINLIS